MDQSAFFTRSSQNEGKKMPLYTPDGTETSEFITVRGSYSDEFRSKNNQALRAAMKEKLTEQEREQLRLESLAALVGGWSFTEPCTPENVVNFLREAPQIAESINTFSANLSNFCEKKSESSDDSPETTSN